ARHVDHVVQLVGPAHVSVALDYVFDISELEEHLALMKATFPPGLGYELGARFLPPEQIEEIVATLQGWGYRDDDLKALLGGSLQRLARTVWKVKAQA
ncbi:MAG: peptidase M19, partial [Alphaproteobacteria bacterium PA3]